MVATLNNSLKYWFANNAGSASFGGCFVSSGISYVIWNRNTLSFDTKIGSTGDVANAYFVSHLIGRDTDLIIANTDYIQLKVINGGVDLALDDVTWIYSNTPAYCAPTVGDASFTSTPSGARIWIESITDTGLNTPNTITGLAPGNHTYTLKLTGYADYAGSFTINAGFTTDVPTTFMASASFTSLPSGAIIWIDNIDQLVNTPYTITGINAGNHTFTLELLGYADYTGNFIATAGTTTVIPLATFMASAYLTSNPSNARIWIDDVDQLVNTPYTITGLTAGNHIFTLKLLGYVDYTGNFTTTLGTITTVPTATFTVSICSWISGKGGPMAITAYDIMTLVSTYAGITNIGFVVTSAYIMGTVQYYSGNITSGNSLTGCTF